jgi:hypothetical protein
MFKEMPTPIFNNLFNGALDYSHAMNELSRPSLQLQSSIKISLDGDKWCALYGYNLQGGVAGFGDSPDKAMRDFDKQWTKERKSK